MPTPVDSEQASSQEPQQEMPIQTGPVRRAVNILVGIGVAGGYLVFRGARKEYRRLHPQSK